MQNCQTKCRKTAVEIWKNMQKVNQIIYRQLQKNFYSKGITAVQFELLMLLKEHKVLPMKKISKYLAVTGGNVTGLVDRLEKKGLVQRERSEKDRRVIKASITKLGKKIYNETIQEFEESLLAILSSLEDWDLDEFNHILKKLYKELEKKYS